jgi:ABC-2 type transport system ATP-binding protein
MGLIFPDDGEMEIFGCPAGDLRAKSKTGFLPENPYFYEYLKAEEFLGLVASLTGVAAAERKQRIGTMLKKVGLSGATDRPLRKFSKGMLQRIGLAQALINDPDLVVLDEPLSGLDPIGRKEIRDIVQDLGRHGKTVLFSSHILSDVELLCDRVAIMEQGSLRHIGPIDELLSHGGEESEVVLERADQAILELAKQQGGTVERHGNRLQIKVRGKEQKDRLVARAVERGVSVLSVSPRKSSLEEMFVAQTAASGSSSAEGEGAQPADEEKEQ